MPETQKKPDADAGDVRSKLAQLRRLLEKVHPSLGTMEANCIESLPYALLRTRDTARMEALGAALITNGASILTQVESPTTQVSAPASGKKPSLAQRLTNAKKAAGTVPATYYILRMGALPELIANLEMREADMALRQGRVNYAKSIGPAAILPSKTKPAGGAPAPSPTIASPAAPSPVEPVLPEAGALGAEEPAGPKEPSAWDQRHSGGFTGRLEESGHHHPKDTEALLSACEGVMRRMIAYDVLEEDFRATEHSDEILAEMAREMRDKLSHPGRGRAPRRAERIEREYFEAALAHFAAPGGLAAQLYDDFHAQVKEEMAWGLPATLAHAGR